MSPPRRTRLWIDPPTQLQLLAFVLGILAGGMLLVYLSLDRGLEEAARATSRVAVPVEWARSTFRSSFAVASAVGLLAGGVLTVLWSHSLVGPLMVLAGGLRRMRDGDLQWQVRIRGTDAFAQAVKEFQDAQEALRARAQARRARLERLEERLKALAATALADDLRRELDAVRHGIKEASREP